jgi:hypothetical protein
MAIWGVGLNARPGEAPALGLEPRQHAGLGSQLYGTPNHPSSTVPADRARLDDMLPRHFDMLEVWVLVLCGLYGLLVGILLTPTSATAKLMCVGFLALALQRNLRPPRKRSQSEFGGFIALLLMAVIYADPASDGVAGPYLFLFFLVAMAYPLMMHTRTALLFTGLLMVLYFASSWLQPHNLPPALFVLRGILLVGVCMLSTRFGMLLRQTQGDLQAMRHDIDSMAYNEYGLNQYGSRIVRACAKRGEPCSLVLLRMPGDWLELMELRSKHDVYCAALRDMASTLQALLPARGLVARCGREGDWVLLAPGMQRHQIIGKLTQALGRPLQLGFGPRQQDLFVVLFPCAVLAESANDTAGSMLQRARVIWQRGLESGAMS